MPVKKKSDLKLFKRLLIQAKPYWLYILGIFFVDLLATPLVLLTPVPLKIVVDNVIDNKPLPAFLESLLPVQELSPQTVLLLAVFLVVLVALFTQLRSLGSSFLRTYTGEKLVLDFRGLLFRHAQRLSLTFHDNKGTSDSTYRIQYDTYAIQYIAIDGIIPFITAIVTLVSMLYVIFRIDWELALVALAVSPFLFLITRFYRLNLRYQSRQVKKLESVALSVIQEVLTALRVVKAFGQEDREQERFMRKSDEGAKARIRFTLTSDGMGLLLGMVTAIGTAVVLYVGVRNVLEGILTLGSLLLVMGYLTQLYTPLRTISRKIASLQNHLASAERAFSLLDETPDVDEKPDAQSISRVRGEVVFQDVSFSYEKVKPILKNISFEIPAGSIVGIAGRTGAGKTTIVNLLTRFFDPVAGRVMIDGLDIRDYKIDDLRNQFAIVLQEPLLFSTSIGENIGYAEHQASQERIVQATKAANIHDFIMRLPDAYETQVGERGMRLSGGERQRIALARAFLKDAPILIMDEPTSSVDLKTESQIIDAMEKLMIGRTTFIIAHRLSTLENCDILIIIENGKIAEITRNVSSTLRRVLDIGHLGNKQ